MTVAPLPSRPFGAAAAACFESEAACGEFTSRLPDAPSRFGAIGPGAAFRARLRNVALPGVSLVAGVSTPKATTHAGRRSALVIPFARCETVLRTGVGEYRWAAPYHAFFIPAGESIAAESTAGAFLRLDIVESDLARTAAGMVDDGGGRPGAVDLRTARPVPLQAGGWSAVIRSLCATIDALDCDPARLTAAGFDDVVLRTVAAMLRPDLAAAADPTQARRAARFDLDPLLEAITASLCGRVTLADMERWSGRTARTIQLAFQRRFGLGPMQWVRDRRLELVRMRLLAARNGETVREIAAACGMHRQATLSTEYVRRFGERPSDTLRRANR